MTKYEVLCLLSGNHSDDEIIPIKDKIREMIKKRGGLIVSEENFGKRKLAYPIKQIRAGFYILIEFDAETESIKKLDDDLRLSPEIMRHIVVKRAARKPQRLPFTPRPTEKESFDFSKPLEEEKLKSKMTMEDLDKKLDEILEGDIL